jgi:hypothetical protein|tara:strand:- start:333 stop:509 length:177 start_codon:yes stop_codon:yes gene_type:complete
LTSHGRQSQELCAVFVANFPRLQRQILAITHANNAQGMENASSGIPKATNDVTNAGVL